MLFIETPIFTKQASGGLFTDVELKQLQQELLENPNKGGDKSGGFRVIYCRSTPEVIFLLLAYPKNKQDNLSKAELKLLLELID